MKCIFEISLFVYKQCSLSYWTSACSLSVERGGHSLVWTHKRKGSTPNTKDAKMFECLYVCFGCVRGWQGPAQCPWGNVHLLSSASAPESPAVRSHSTSSPQRPALPAWEEGGSLGAWHSGRCGFPCVAFSLCAAQGGEGGGPAIPTATSPSLCEGRTQKACRRRKQAQKKRGERKQGQKQTRKDCVAFML